MELKKLRKAIERLLLNSVRFYTFNTPISKGKYRLYQAALDFCRYPPKQLNTTIHDGRRFQIDLSGGMHKSVFFLGEYERAVTDVISSVVRPKDVCLDIGANFGWYTTLLNRICTEGEVHAFEPLPDVFEELKQNWKLAGEPKNVFLNKLALGDEVKIINFHRFKNLPSGFSSISTHGKEDFETFSVQMTTLDSYLTENKVGGVDFIKIDVEGAELMFLKGATRLFEQQTPPLIMAEMALGTTKGFGYLPNDLIEFIRERAEYEFYALNDYNGTLRKIEGFSTDDIGANVLCAPKKCELGRLKNLKFA
jgi:FkbM family methyltransferase